MQGCKWWDGDELVNMHNGLVVQEIFAKKINCQILKFGILKNTSQITSHLDYVLIFSNTLCMLRTELLINYMSPHLNVLKLKKQIACS